MATDVPKRLHELLSAEMVDIFVGPKRKQFRVHKDLICERSAFFNSGFDKAFKEAQEGSMYFAEDDVAAFELFVEWLYTGRLGDMTDSHYDAYFFLYFLATKWCIESLQNVVMDQIQVYFWREKTWPDPDSLQFFWTNTSSSSKLRQCMSRLVAMQLLRSTDFEIWKPYMEVGDEILVDVMAHIHGSWLTKRLPYIPSVPDCTYHQHNETEKCKAV